MPINAHGEFVEDIPKIKLGTGRIPQPKQTPRPAPVSTPQPEVTRTISQEETPHISFESINAVVDKAKRYADQPTSSMSPEKQAMLKQNLERVSEWGKTHSTTGGVTAAEAITYTNELKDILNSLEVDAMSSGDTRRADELKGLKTELNAAEKKDSSSETQSSQEDDGNKNEEETAASGESQPEIVDDKIGQSLTGDPTKKDETPSSQENKNENQDATTKPTEAKSDAEKKEEEREITMKYGEFQKLLNHINSGTGEKTDEEKNKNKSHLLRNIIGGTLLTGIGGLGTYLIAKNNHKANEPILKKMEDQVKTTQGNLAKNPTDPVVKTAHQEALENLIAAQRKDVIENAFRLMKKDKQDRLKAANDVGLNLGNFAKIFSSDTNRDSLNNVSDLSHMLNIHSRQVNPYI
jgi:hypothetical protein